MNNYQIIINGYHEPRKKLTTKETYALIDEYQKTKDEKIKEKFPLASAETECKRESLVRVVFISQ